MVWLNKDGSNKGRAHRNYRERGMAKYTYTLRDIAEAAERKLATIRWDVNRTGDNRVVRDDLRSLASYILRGVQWKRRASLPLAGDELGTWLDQQQLRQHWDNRWPRFQAYRCFVCPVISLHRGFCKNHGGPWTAPLYLQKGYLWVRMDKPRAYHQLVATAPPGHEIHHKDHNKLNNRVPNLDTSMTHEEHWAHHHGTRREARERTGKDRADP